MNDQVSKEFVSIKCFQSEIQEINHTIENMSSRDNQYEDGILELEIEMPSKTNYSKAPKKKKKRTFF